MLDSLEFLDDVFKITYNIRAKERKYFFIR